MSGFTFVSIGLAFLSVILALYAARIAKKSDNKMKAIADSLIDEKLAIMAEHLALTRINLKNNYVLYLNEMRRINNDFNAVSDLKNYASDKKKEELIEDYMIPILKNLYSMKKKYQIDFKSMGPNELKRKYLDIDPNECIEWKNILNDITKTTLGYDIEIVKIRNIIKRNLGKPE